MLPSYQLLLLFQSSYCGTLSETLPKTACLGYWVFPQPVKPLGFLQTSAKAHDRSSTLSRSAEALLPPHECGGSHQRTLKPVLFIQRVFPQPVDPHSRSHTGTLYASDLYLRVMGHNEGTW